MRNVTVDHKKSERGSPKDPFSCTSRDRFYTFCITQSYLSPVLASAYNFICAQRVNKKAKRRDGSVRCAIRDVKKEVYKLLENVRRQRQAMSDARWKLYNARWLKSCKRIKIYSTLASGIKRSGWCWGWRKARARQKIIKFIISCGWDWELFPAGGTTKQNLQ